MTGLDIIILGGGPAGMSAMLGDIPWGFAQSCSKPRRGSAVR